MTARLTKPPRKDCPICKGQGYYRYPYLAVKPVPAHWFTKGAHPCDYCEDDE